MPLQWASPLHPPPDLWGFQENLSNKIFVFRVQIGGEVCACHPDWTTVRQRRISQVSIWWEETPDPGRKKPGMWGRERSHRGPGPGVGERSLEEGEGMEG